MLLKYFNIFYSIQHRIHQMKPSMSIGRNYRLGLEKRLREINHTREKSASWKILDEHGHLINNPNSHKSKKMKFDKPDVKIENNKSSGVVPLAVNNTIVLCV